MKKHIILSVLISAVSLAPNAAVFANSYPANDPNLIIAKPVVSEPIIDPAPRAECLAINLKSIGIGASDKKLEKYGAVMSLQTLLKENGFLLVSPTGYFGSITSNSVKNFQKKYGIPATGFFGPLTRGKIIALYCNLGQVPPPVPGSSLNVTSPKAGDILTRDTSTKITWTDRNVYIQAAKYDITLSPESPCVANRPCALMMVKPYSIATAVTLATDGYSWKVGSTIEADRTIPDGEYRINICPNGGTGNCAQGELFKIRTNTTATASTTLYSVSPNNGPVGKFITVVGRNLESIKNINFGYGYIPMPAQTLGMVYDGEGAKSFTFKVPSTQAPSCAYSTPRCYISDVLTTPGVYDVSVTNSDGTVSNKLPFTVTAGTQ